MAKLNPARTVTVTTTATLVSDSTKVWKSRLIRNTDASASVFWGDSTVTATGGSKGMELKAGEGIGGLEATTSRIYAITASGTVDVSVSEVG